MKETAARRRIQSIAGKEPPAESRPFRKLLKKLNGESPFKGLSPFSSLSKDSRKLLRFLLFL
ncbi:hypothetical protein CH238_03655 [[Clostridium] leptum DSM 753]|uniref:Uncharacterized protein n=1 Tax=[Clostridium] leptum DSM 753 TaxID=428125 RepID=A0A855A5S2_9FIRM|nr:hypothetical protein CH238_03655 [[Clostridium] leptum DSM 753]